MPRFVVTGAGRTGKSLIAGAVMGVFLAGASACALGASMGAASTHGGATLYRSATAFVQLAPDRAFNPAVKVLLERSDIEITDLKEANSRCKAVVGDRTLTFRVIESGEGRSRMSILIGRGDGTEANQQLADALMQQICGRLEVACEHAS